MPQTTGTTKELIVPSVHSNGSGKERLKKQLEEAYEALSASLLKLKEAAPNGRDYYVYGNDVIYRAVAEWTSRHARIVNVMSELEALMNGMDDLQQTVDVQLIAE